MFGLPTEIKLKIHAVHIFFCPSVVYDNKTASEMNVPNIKVTSF